MYNLVYLILILYAIKISIIKSKQYVLNKKSISVINESEDSSKENHFKIKIISFKSIVNFIKKNNSFILPRNKMNEEEKNKVKEKEKWQESRHQALEKAKYKCEECGNITNLEVYSKNNSDELVVLCKKCHSQYDSQVLAN